MRKIVFPLIVLALINCSSKRDESNSFGKKTQDKGDTIYFDGTSFYKRYINDFGGTVSESQELHFFERKEDSVLIKTTTNLSQFPGNYPVYKLKIEAYEKQKSNYRLLWSKDIEDNVPVGIWSNYLQTKRLGCCGSEDGMTLFNLDDGKEFIKFNGSIKSSFTSESSYNIGYHSASSVNYKHSVGPTTDMGVLYFFTETDSHVSSFEVQFKGNDDVIEMMAHSPDMEIQSKSWISESGFFRAFNLYKNGEQLKSLDTANNYLVMRYGFSKTILVPIEAKTILERGLISNDLDLSKNFSLEKQ